MGPDDVAAGGACKLTLLDGHNHSRIKIENCRGRADQLPRPLERQCNHVNVESGRTVSKDDYYGQNVLGPLCQYNVAMERIKVN